MKKIALLLMVLVLSGALLGAFDVLFEEPEEKSAEEPAEGFKLGVVQDVAADTTCENGHHGC